MAETTEENPFHSILQAFGISPLHFTVIPHKTSLGLINTTYFVIHTGDTNEGEVGNDSTSLTEESTGVKEGTSGSVSTGVSPTPSYVLQLFNHTVFDPSIVETNILSCTTKLQASSAALSSSSSTSSSHSCTHVQYLSYLTTIDHRHFHIDNDGRYYRMMKYIPGYAYETCSNSMMAYHMGYAYGSFVRELNTNALGDTEGVGALGVQEAIPRFHDLAYRYDEFIRVVEEAEVVIDNITTEQERDAGQKDDDVSSTKSIISLRYDRAQSMIQDAKYFHCLVDQSQELIAQGLPLRVMHGDAKVSNLLFSLPMDNTNDASYDHGSSSMPASPSSSSVLPSMPPPPSLLSSSSSLLLPVVLDWDTIMPGYFWSDLGDMIRSTLVRREEDNDTDITDGGWQPQEMGVDGRNGALQRELPEGLARPLAEGQGRVEGDQCTSLGVAFLPGCDVLEWENVEGVVQGWIEGMGPSLTPLELNNIWFASKHMIYMQFLRFLADYLQNDTYYRVKDAEQNWRRSKVQLAILKALHRHKP